MPLNFRQKLYLQNAILGSGGASVSEMLFGSTTVNVASTTTGSTYVTTFSVTGLNATANIFVQVNKGLSGCAILTAACVSEAGTVSASFRTTASTSGSGVSACSIATVNYFAVN